MYNDETGLLEYKIEEVSVKMRNREFGKSMHGGIVAPIKYMIKICEY